MKILIVHPSFWINGGAEKVIIRLANWLTEHHISNTILTTQMCEEVREQLKETRLLLCNNLQELSIVLNHIHEDFDVINYHNDPVQMFAFGKTSPNIWLCNEPPLAELGCRQITPEEIKMVKKSIKKVIVADEFNRKRFKEIFDMDAEVVPYGIDYDFFSNGNKDKAIDKWNLKDKFVMLQVGFISPTKNQLKTIEILKEIKGKIPNVVLVLAGNDSLDYTNGVRKKIAEYDLIENVVFTGFLSQEDVRDLYRASDVVLAPIKSQGGWLSIFDAICSGTPTIVSKEATASSIVENNKLGLIEDYVENILKIYNKEDLGLTPKEWIKENLTWDKFCSGIYKYCMEAK